MKGRNGEREKERGEENPRCQRGLRVMMYIYIYTHARCVQAIFINREINNKFSCFFWCSAH